MGLLTPVISKHCNKLRSTYCFHLSHCHSTCLFDNTIKQEIEYSVKNNSCRFLQIKKNVNHIGHDEAVWYNAFHIVNDNYRQTSNMSHTLVGNKTVDHSDVVGSFSTRLQWIRHRQLQDEPRNIQVFGFGVRYIRGLIWYIHYDSSKRVLWILLQE